MADPEHVAILNQGVEAWNKWRKENPDIIPDLSGADLSGRNFTCLDLPFKAQVRKILREGKQRAKTSQTDSPSSMAFVVARNNGINLINAKLQGAQLSKALLIGAQLRDANLLDANLEEAALPWSILSNSTLLNTKFNGAILPYSSLDGARLFHTKFNQANLSGASLEKSTLFEVELKRANLTRTNFAYTRFFYANLTEARLCEADLRLVSLIGTNFLKAVLTNCKVYGISAWDIDTTEAKQSGLRITDFFDPVVTVDNIEVAQFIHLLLKNQKIRNVIDTITSKVVLILGRFTPERKQVLDAIKEELRKRDYVPVMFDFEKPASRNFTETVNILAHLARFVIADLTDPRSIPQELASLVPFLTVPVVPLLKEGSEPWAMFQDFSIKNGVLKIVSYRSVTDLLANFQEKIIQPAEQKAQELIIEKGRPPLYP